MWSHEPLSWLVCPSCSYEQCWCLRKMARHVPASVETGDQGHSSQLLEHIKGVPHCPQLPGRYLLGSCLSPQSSLSKMAVPWCQLPCSQPPGPGQADPGPPSPDLPLTLEVTGIHLKLRAVQLCRHLPHHSTCFQLPCAFCLRWRHGVPSLNSTLGSHSGK